MCDDLVTPLTIAKILNVLSGTYCAACGRGGQLSDVKWQQASSASLSTPSATINHATTPRKPTLWQQPHSRNTKFPQKVFATTNNQTAPPVIPTTTTTTTTSTIPAPGSAISDCQKSITKVSEARLQAFLTPLKTKKTTFKTLTTEADTSTCETAGNKNNTTNNKDKEDSLLPSQIGEAKPIEMYKKMLIAQYQQKNTRREASVTLENLTTKKHKKQETLNNDVESDEDEK